MQRDLSLFIVFSWDSSESDPIDFAKTVIETGLHAAGGAVMEFRGHPCNGLQQHGLVVMFHI